MDSQQYTKALKIAQEAHNGQYRITGESYINHPLRVAKKQESVRGMIIGLLHDVIEDCPHEYFERITDEFPELIESLNIVTHNTNKLSYEQYIDKICSYEDRDILLVKLADIIDNLNMSKWNINLIDDSQVNRVERYSKALKKIYNKLKEIKNEN